MELHNLKPAKGSTHGNKRKGRGPGSGQGETGGRGHKGAGSRSGYKSKLGFEGGQTPLQRRMPKIGFKSLTDNSYKTFNLSQLQSLIEKFNLTEISHASLLEVGACRKKDRIKILGNGTLSSGLKISAHATSASAKEKIEAKGGTLEILQ